MGFKRRKALIAGFITAALGFWLLARLIWEPTYHGRSLNTWLVAYDARDSHGNPIPAPEADAALRAMGSRAIPGLLRRLRATPTIGLPKLIKQSSVPKAVLIPPPFVTVGGVNVFPITPYGYTLVGPGIASNKINLALSTAVPSYAQSPVAKFAENHTPFFIERRWTPANQQWWNVYAAFQALGPLGEPAIPELARLARNMNDSAPLRFTTNSLMANLLVFRAQPPAVRFTAALAIQPRPSRFWSNHLVAESLNLGVAVSSVTQNYLDGDIAAWSLAAIGARGVPALQQLLDDPNPALQVRAALALGMVGADAQPAIPALLKILQKPDSAVRLPVLEAMGNMGRMPDTAIPTLIGLLKEEDLRTRFLAMYCLAQSGRTAANAVPALLRIFTSFWGVLKQSAAVAVSQISPETTANEVVPSLLLDLQDSKPLTRNRALETLAQLQDHPPGIIPVVSAALDDSDNRVQLKAILLLADLGPAAKEAVPKLIALTKNPDAQIRQESAAALNRIDPAWRNLGR